MHMLGDRKRYSTIFNGLQSSLNGQKTPRPPVFLCALCASAREIQTVRFLRYANCLPKPTEESARV